MTLVLGQLFTGISIGAVLLLIALGLSLTFGQMGAINIGDASRVLRDENTEDFIATDRIEKILGAACSNERRRRIREHDFAVRPVRVVMRRGTEDAKNNLRIALRIAASNLFSRPTA